MTLRAVKAAERAPRKPRAKSVTQAARNGTPRELLVAMRDRIALAVEDKGTAARDLAALTKRLTEVTNAIETIDAREAEADPTSAPEDEAFDPSAI